RDGGVRRDADPRRPACGAYGDRAGAAEYADDSLEPDLGVRLQRAAGSGRGWYTLSRHGVVALTGARERCHGVVESLRGIQQSHVAVVQNFRSGYACGTSTELARVPTRCSMSPRAFSADGSLRLRNRRGGGPIRGHWGASPSAYAPRVGITPTSKSRRIRSESRSSTSSPSGFLRKCTGS